MMKTFSAALAAWIGLAAMAGCGGLGDPAAGGSLRITVTPGEEWIHPFSALVKNPPQYALWIEDEGGAYLGSVFVTRKAATEGWVLNKGNRRREALPVWSRRRGIAADDGIYLPTREEPLADGVTGATPKAVQTLAVVPDPSLTRFWLFCEINHSTDFNAAWPKDAAPGDPGWSGGPEGSGQPSLVYGVLIDLADPGPWTLSLIGRGSADGADGSVDADLTGLTTALGILGGVVVESVP
jgi:hypothetical protein